MIRNLSHPLGNFFHPNVPKYLNYGGIGSVIGHEITHGFDDQGKKTDFTGTLTNWWNPDTNTNFQKRAQCIVSQYGNYTAKQVNLTINGIFTQGENIADNGGIREAYLAYGISNKTKTEFSLRPRCNARFVIERFVISRF